MRQILHIDMDAFFAALALALGAGWGFYLADYLQRRRHGGFRI